MKRRTLGFRLASMAIGVSVTLVFCEILARVFWPAATVGDLVELRAPAENGNDAGMHCYPSKTVEEMPYDLRRPDDRNTLALLMPQFYVTNRPFPDELRKLGIPPEEWISADLGLKRLAGAAPYCIRYALNTAAPRVFARAPKCAQTVALLGDSFTVGQGVIEQKSLPVQLSALTGTCIRSYARIGANFPEIMEQFSSALKDRTNYGFSQIFYVFVLNDPPMTKQLAENQENIFDLMNLRSAAWKQHSSVVVRLVWALADYSALARLAIDRVALTATTTQTLEWYRNLFNPEINRGLVSMFKELGSMKEKAAQAGVRFNVVIYPMMLDFDQYPLKKEHDTLREQLVARGIEVLDLLPAFTREHRGRVLFVHPIDHHPNGAAQEIAAREMARQAIFFDKAKQVSN